MLFVPPGPGFAPPPGSGSIQQAYPTDRLYAVSIDTPGSGYTISDIVNVNGGVGGQAEITQVVLGIPLAIRSTAQGSGYTDRAVETTSGGTGTGLEVVTYTSRRNMVRVRTIQHQRRAAVPRGGFYDTRYPQMSLGTSSRRYLGACAQYWANTLTGGQRSAWDAAMPTFANGFEGFIAVQKAFQLLDHDGPFFERFPGWTPPWPTATGELPPTTRANNFNSTGRWIAPFQDQIEWDPGTYDTTTSIAITARYQRQQNPLYTAPDPTAVAKPGSVWVYCGIEGPFPGGPHYYSISGWVWRNFGSASLGLVYNLRFRYIDQSTGFISPNIQEFLTPPVSP